MSVARQFNWKGQQRVDVAHLRLMESSIAYDFDTLAGQALGGGQPYILSGFAIASWSAGVLPSTLQIVTAGSVVFHYGASENGSMLFVPTNRANETLSISNSRVIGSFVAASTNYVGIDFIRLEDSTTSDIVQFVDATTLSATPKTIPLGRVLDYRIHISTTPFSSTTNICPIAIVVTNGTGVISTVTDARPMYFRLAAGGDSPNPLGTYSWPQGRAPEVATSFTGGDKAITNEKIWKSAIMQRLWEITGGEYWYSDVTDHNLKFYCATAQPFTWTLGSSTLTWSDDLVIALDNSTGTVNTISTNTTPGIVMADGTVAYVELNRFSDANLLPTVVTTAAYNLLAAPARPGSRYIIFWRKGNFVYTRMDYSPVGVSGSVPPASTTTYGTVKTNTAPGSAPYAVLADALGGKAIATGLSRQGTGVAGGLTIGGGANDTSIAITSAGSITVSHATGLNINATAGNIAGLNVTGHGTGYGALVQIAGSAPYALVVQATGSLLDSTGIYTIGKENGYGLYAKGGGTGVGGSAAGVYAEGGTGLYGAGGAGIIGVGVGLGVGGKFSSDSSAAINLVPTIGGPGNPTTTTSGDIWYNGTSNAFMAKLGLYTVVLAAQPIFGPITVSATNWTNGSANLALAVYKTNGIVYMRGMLTATATISSVIATLPAAYWPQGATLLTVPYSTGLTTPFGFNAFWIDETTGVMTLRTAPLNTQNYVFNVSWVAVGS
jgi:hypothetical protein